MNALGMRSGPSGQAPGIPLASHLTALQLTYLSNSCFQQACVIEYFWQSNIAASLLRCCERSADGSVDFRERERTQ